MYLHYPILLFGLVLFDNKHAGYELYDSMTGTRFGGRWEFSVLGEKVFENHDQSYFVGVEDNCNISSVNTSLDGGTEDLKTRLKNLKELLDDGLITQEDYDKKKDEYLKNY